MLHLHTCLERKSPFSTDRTIEKQGAYLHSRAKAQDKVLGEWTLRVLDSRKRMCLTEKGSSRLLFERTWHLLISLVWCFNYQWLFCRGDLAFKDYLLTEFLISELAIEQMAFPVPCFQRFSFPLLCEIIQHSKDKGEKRNWWMLSFTKHDQNFKSAISQPITLPAKVIHN